MHRAKLAKFCGGRNHQNAVLKCEGKLNYTDIRSMKDLMVEDDEEGGKLYLFLD